MGILLYHGHLGLYKFLHAQYISLSELKQLTLAVVLSISLTIDVDPGTYILGRING